VNVDTWMMATCKAPLSVSRAYSPGLGSSLIDAELMQ
jgi:hypothetical protein